MSTDLNVPIIPRPRGEIADPGLGRDFCGEMRQIVDKATAVDAYVPKVVATQIVDDLCVTDPDLLDGWLRAQAAHFIWQMINDRDRSIRSTIRHRAKPGAFAAAVKDHENGDSEPLRGFLDLPLTVADGTRRPLGKLNKNDLLFVRDDYQARADRNAFMAAVVEAISKKIGDGLVEDHYTEAQLAKMFGA